MWYLTEQLVVLALADPGVSKDLKSQMVTSMMAAGRPQHFHPGKPTLKPEVLQGRQPDVPQLFEFVGERSWLLFHLLNLGIQWMHQPPAHCIDNAEYRRFQHYIENLAVVNDAAERAVKDVTDFAEYSQDPDRHENVIKVVNSHRELFDFAHLTKDEIGNI